jgi:hypothetical protein
VVPTARLRSQLIRRADISHRRTEEQARLSQARFASGAEHRIHLPPSFQGSDTRVEAMIPLRRWSRQPLRRQEGSTLD